MITTPAAPAVPTLTPAPFPPPPELAAALAPVVPEPSPPREYVSEFKVETQPPVPAAGAEQVPLPAVLEKQNPLPPVLIAVEFVEPPLPTPRNPPAFLLLQFTPFHGAPV